VRLEGDFLSIGLYPGKSYRHAVVAKAFEDLLAMGCRPKMASLWDVRPSAIDHEMLYNGEYETVDLDFSKPRNRNKLGNHVLHRCVMELSALPIPCEFQLMCSFNDDKTFDVNVDFPYWALFRENRLTIQGSYFAELIIETLALVLFESGFYLYGGVEWEYEVPTLFDLRTRSKTLPEHCGLYSAPVVDKLGRSRLMDQLRPARRLHQFHQGGVYFSWDYWYEEHAASDKVPQEFKAFIANFDSTNLEETIE